MPKDTFQKILFKNYLLSMITLFGALFFGKLMMNVYLQALDVTKNADSYYWLFVGVFAIGYLLLEVGYRFIKTNKSHGIFFERFTPLIDFTNELSEQFGIRYPRLIVTDNTSLHANSKGALFQGGEVGLSMPALTHLTQRHNEAIIAHELAHIRLKHTTSTIVTGYLIGGSVDILLIPLILRVSLSPSLYYVSLFFGWFVLKQMARSVLLWISRQHEYAADALGALSLESPYAMIELMRILKAEDPSISCSGIAYLFRTHPTQDERIARLEHLLNDA